MTDFNDKFLQYARKGNLAGMESLIEEGVDVNHPSLFKQTTPLMLAVQSGRLNVIRWLVEQQGADLERVNREGETALTLLYDNPQLRLNQIITYLLEQGANVNHPDNNGFTPIIKSTFYEMHHDLNFFQQLLDYNADIMQKHNGGMSAWDMAKTSKRTELYDLFSAHYERQSLMTYVVDVEQQPLDELQF